MARTIYRLAALSAALLLAARSEAAVCHVTAGGSIASPMTLSGPLGTSGTATWSGCTGAGNGPSSLFDSIVVDAGAFAVITGSLGTTTSHLSGGITVNGWLGLDDGAQAAVYEDGPIAFAAGSDGRFQGNVLADFYAPDLTTFTSDGSTPSSTDITLDYGNVIAAGATLPWELCASGCANPWTSIHPAYDGVPATYVYIEWDKLTAYGVPHLSPSGQYDSTLVDAQGMFLPVVRVAGAAFSVRLPTLGNLHGANHFGADGVVIPTADSTGTLQSNGSGGDRCPQCLTKTAPAGLRQGVDQTPDGGGAAVASDYNGAYLRNAVLPAETPNAWVVKDVARTFNADGKVKMELLVDDASFTHRRSFEGFLACDPQSQGDASVPYDPASETWCARIVSSEDHIQRPNSAACSGSSYCDSIEVWSDPRSGVRVGDRLNVYYARVAPADHIVPMNLHLVQGANQQNGSLQIDAASRLGISAPLRALRFDGNGTASGVEFLHVGNPGFAMDAVLFEHIGTAWSSINNVAVRVVLPAGVSAGPTLTRIQCRWPNSTSILTGFNVLGDFCVLFSAVNSSYYPNPDTWTGTKLRKIRTDGYPNSVNMDAGVYTDCPDGLLLQDLLFVHGRLAGTMEGSWNTEMLEYQGATNGCDSDRIAEIGATSGAPFISRDAGNPGGWRTTVTSVAIAGVNSKAAPQDFDAWAHGMTVDLVGVNNHGPNGFRVVNAITNAYVHDLVGEVDYLAHVGWFPEMVLRSGASAGVPGFSGCQDDVGLFSIGGLNGGSLGWNNTSGTDQGQRCQPDKTVHVLDAYIINMQPNPPDPGEYPSFQFLSTTAAAGVLPAAVVIDSFVLAGSATDTGIRFFAQGSNAIGQLTIDNGTLFSLNANAGGPLNAFIVSQNDFTKVRIGPNLFAGTTGSSTTSCASDVFANPRGCVVTDAAACGGSPAGCGAASSGWQEGPGVAFFGATTNPGNDVWDPRFLSFSPLSSSLPYSSACQNTTNPDGSAASPSTDPPAIEPCNFGAASPRWSGPMSYDWPFAWMTVDPIPGYHRTGPRLEYVPAILQARLPCQDGIDNDGDGLIDLADPDCMGDPTHPSESPACSDGLDNDNDGLIDFDGGASAHGGIAVAPPDPGCANAASTTESPACQDGIDNDGDGGIDFDGGAAANRGIPLAKADLDCYQKPFQNFETAVKTGCGLGAELVLAIPLLARWHRSRRRRTARASREA